jgi:hypothetical protein
LSQDAIDANTSFGFTINFLAHANERIAFDGGISDQELGYK